MQTKLSFSDIVDLFAAKTGQSKKEAESFLRELLDVISSQIEEDGLVKLKDFGTFKIIEVGSRESVDVNTGSKIVIAAHKKISFLPDKILKDLVNKPFALFEPELLNENVNFDDAQENLPSEVDEDEPEEQSTEEESVEQLAESSNLISKALSGVSSDDVLEEEVSAEKESSIEQASVLENVLPVIQEVSKELDTKLPVEDVVASDDADVAEEIDIAGSEKPESEKIEPVLDEENEDSEPQNESKAKRWWILIAVCAAVILIPLILYLFYFSDTNEYMQPQQVQPIVAVKDTVSEDSIKLQVEAMKKDSLHRVAIAELKKDSLQAAKKEKVEEEGKRVAASQTVVVPKGYTFRLLALKYYGSKEFWVYIYQANKAKIPLPNNLTSGLKVVVPDAESLGIDATDPASIHRAKQLSTKVLNGIE